MKEVQTHREQRAVPDVADSRQGDHACAVYDDAAAQAGTIAGWVRDGLARGERCVWVTDDRTEAEVRAALLRSGVDVGAARSAGGLRLYGKRDTYLSGGAFEPAERVQVLRRMTDEALADGFRGLRITGEMTWALAAESGCDRLIEYESLLDDFLSGSRAQAICQYNRRRFPPATMRAMLRRHARAVIGDRACPNPYYEPRGLGDPDGEARQVQYMIERIADARAAQARLEELNERLEEHACALEVAVQAREDFLSVAAHELKTPLNALQLAADLLRHGGAGDDALETARASIRRQVKRLGSLVDLLLDVSRLTEDRLDLEYTPGDLRDVVREAAERFELDARQAGCDVCVEGDSVPGRWDATRVDQIVANLLSNALKYGRGAPVVLRVSADETGDLAEVTVRDGGPGIPAAEQERLFERFERLSSSRGTSGLGLGLWIVRQLAVRMGGDVRVASAPGAGASFTLRIPRRSAAACLVRPA